MTIELSNTWFYPLIRDNKLYRRFKLAYHDALTARKETYVFDGQDIVVKFAFYLLEYVDKLRRKRMLKVFIPSTRKWIK